MTAQEILVVILGITFLPLIVANGRRHCNRLAISVLNILVVVALFIAQLSIFMALVLALFGIPAWVVALIWACTNNIEPKAPKVMVSRQPALNNWDKLKAKQWNTP